MRNPLQVLQISWRLSHFLRRSRHVQQPGELAIARIAYRRRSLNDESTFYGNRIKDPSAFSRYVKQAEDSVTILVEMRTETHDYVITFV